jgi:hypothetical protein
MPTTQRDGGRPLTSERHWTAGVLAQPRPPAQTGFMPEDDYAQVPEVDGDAEIDPHWLELRGSPALPPTYLPPSMSGSHTRTSKATAAVLIAVFLLATALGVCLTYGPQVLAG